jgi:hypothetical protein
LLNIRVFNAELALGVGTHCIDQMLRGQEDRVSRATSDLNDWDVVAAESRNGVELPLSLDLLA